MAANLITRMSWGGSSWSVSVSSVSVLVVELVLGVVGGVFFLLCVARRKPLPGTDVMSVGGSNREKEKGEWHKSHIIL